MSTLQVNSTVPDRSANLDGDTQLRETKLDLRCYALQEAFSLNAIIEMSGALKLSRHYENGMAYTMLTVPADLNAAGISPFCTYDQKLTEKPIVTYANKPGVLRDRAITRSEWGREIGDTINRLPVSSLNPDKYNAAGMITQRADKLPVVVCAANHFGWHSGEFLIENGVPILLCNDVDRINGRYSIIGYSSARKMWENVEVEFYRGRLIEESIQQIADIRVGLSVPPMIVNGKALAVKHLLQYERFTADVRNFLDFYQGQAVSSEIDHGLRMVVAALSEKDISNLLEGECVEWNGKIDAEGKIAGLARFINTSGSKFFENFKMVIEGDNFRFSNKHPMPHNDMPVMMYGINRNNELLIFCFDGRQEEIPGISFEKAALYLVEHHDVKFGGPGCSGLDAAISGTNGILTSYPADIGKMRNIPCAIGFRAEVEFT